MTVSKAKRVRGFPWKIGAYSVFSSTTHDIRRDTLLWRYMTFEKFAWLLETSQLYHTRLDQLGDPFEGSMTKAYVEKREAGTLPLWIIDEVNAKFNAVFNWRGVFLSYVTCWYESPYESDAMWKLYAPQHAGVAIVTTPTKIWRAVDFAPHLHGILGPVDYMDFETDWYVQKPFPKPPRPGFIKRKAFEHEKEVRGMIMVQDSERNPLSPDYLATLPDRPLGIAAKVSLKKLLQAIYISPLAKPYFEEIVRIAARRRGLESLVHKSRLLGQPVF